jgi:hypothetical protein
MRAMSASSNGRSPISQVRRSRTAPELTDCLIRFLIEARIRERSWLSAAEQHQQRHRNSDNVKN